MCVCMGKKFAYVLPPWHFFLLWFVHFPWNGNIEMDREYGLMSPLKMFRDLILAVFQSFGGFQLNSVAPKWFERSFRRDPFESLNVHRRTITTQYSTVT